MFSGNSDYFILSILVVIEERQWHRLESTVLFRVIQLFIFQPALVASHSALITTKFELKAKLQRQHFILPEEVPNTTTNNFQAGYNCDQGLSMQESKIKIQHCLKPSKSQYHIQYLYRVQEQSQYPMSSGTYMSINSCRLTMATQ